MIQTGVVSLVDGFRTQKIEIDYSLDDVKLFYASLKLQEENNFNFTSSPYTTYSEPERLSLILLYKASKQPLKHSGYNLLLLNKEFLPMIFSRDVS